MCRILIAEDDRDLCWIWSETLADAGHDVVLTHDGEAAASALESAEFDILICDVVMPVSGAIVLAGFARKLQPDIRVIAVTGSLALRDAPLEDEIFGVERTLRKPINLDTLCAIVDEPDQANAA
jgi:DNA-binding NtrC family response regulator